MENRAARDGYVEHFLQTKRLGAELRVVVFLLPTLAYLELDGNQPLVAADVRRL
jgi:hypothetical protein